MKLPLEITSRNIELTEEIKDLIHDKAGKLDSIYDDIIRCRVVVEIPHRSQQSGEQYNARIDITVPGGEVVVKREPNDDLYAAIVDSFDVAERRLKEYAEKQRGDVKRHEEKPVAKVNKIFLEDGYGFLVTPSGREIYFHKNSVINERFENLKIGTTVEYVEQLGEKGPQASAVKTTGI
jgi:ribosomal subunit interface protein